jgi:maleate isomerase
MTPTRIGVLLTSDNAIDPELWRWCPPGVSLHITRLLDWDDDEHDDDVSGSLRASQPGVIGPATASFDLIEPEVIVFACTSGSFVEGAAGEARVRETMLAAGAKRALTTSGALLDAIRALDLQRVAVGTPYNERLSRLLQTYLEDAGVEVPSLAWAPPGPGSELVDITEDDLEELAERAFAPDADALFLSCTALETIDLIAPLQERYGVPVITAVQVTMWAALAMAGAGSPTGEHALNALRPPSLDASGAR